MASEPAGTEAIVFLWGYVCWGGLFEAFENKGVGAVNDGGVEAGEVDLGGCFGVVAHAFADYWQWDTFGFGGGGPAVAGDV